MNVSGLKLNLSLIKKFIDYNLNKINENDIKGIFEFEDYKWEEFNYYEFTTLIKAIKVLFEGDVFENISDMQEFVFFYKTDITELDIVTIVNYRKRPVLINIEVKSTLQSSQKLTAQISKRIKEHFPQMIPNMEYVIIGITDTKFIRAKTNLKSHNKLIKNIKNLKEIFDKFTINDNVRNHLVQANNLASIHKIFKSIENKNFNYFEETNSLYNYAKDHLGIDNDIIICLSKAGTGKSIAALKMFFEMENTILLLMNIKLYNTLNLNKYYRANRCTWKPEVFKTFDIENKICIIDEFQRISDQQLKEIVSLSNRLIMFGDLEQAFMENDLSISKRSLQTEVIPSGKRVKLKTLKHVKRFSDSASKCIDYLISYNEINPPEKIHGYEINIFYDENQFIDKYNKCTGIKKIYMTYNHRGDGSLLIGNKQFRLASYDHDNFSIDMLNKSLIGNTLHAISFDVEHCFVYLPDIYLKELDGKVYFVHKNIERDFAKIKKLRNELVILFSRGQVSLNICVKDLKTYLLLNSRYKKIV